MKTNIFSLVLLLFTSLTSGQNFWQATNGPYGGGIICAVAASNGNVFCGTNYAGGVYRTTNNGNNWLNVYPVYAFSGSIRALAVDRFDNIYAGINGVIKSTDGGNSWNQIGSFVFPVSLGINASGYVFAGSYDGHLYRTTNGGANWISVINTYHPIQNITVANNDNIYIASAGGIYKSVDSGNNWVRIDQSALLPVNDISVDSTGSILACNYTGIYKTSNEGANWSLVYNGSGAVTIAVTNTNSYFAGVGGGKIIKSSDGGLTWVEMLNYNTNGYLVGPTDLIWKRDGTLISGTDNGMFFSFDSGVIWQQRNTGIAISHVSSIVSDEIGRIYLGVNSDGVYTSSNSGGSWNHIGLFGKQVMQVVLNGPDNIFAYVIDSIRGTYRSTNGGVNWSRTNTGLPESSSPSSYCVLGGSIFASGDFGVYKSTNNGDLWVPSGLSSVQILRLEKGLSNTLYAFSVSVLYKSTDFGISWTSLYAPGYAMNYFAASSANGYLYYIKSNGNLYRSTNGGLNWNQTNSSRWLGNLTCAPGGLLFTCAQDSLFKSMDFGDTWQQFMSGIPVTDNIVLAFDQQGFGYAGTWGGGVYRSLQSVIAVSTPTDFVPESFSLYQNYPNPFNPSTKIKFDVPRVGAQYIEPLQLKVFNSLGQQIAVLVNEHLQPGSYEVDWNASDYPSGVYFYELRADEFIQTKKMVLIK